MRHEKLRERTAHLYLLVTEKTEHVIRHPVSFRGRAGHFVDYADYSRFAGLGLSAGLCFGTDFERSLRNPTTITTTPSIAEITRKNLALSNKAQPVNGKPPFGVLFGQLPLVKKRKLNGPKRIKTAPKMAKIDRSLKSVAHPVP